MSVLKNVRIRGFSGPYFLAFGLNTDQKGSKHRYSLRSEIKLVIHSFYLLEMIRVILSFLKILSLKKRFNRFFSIQKICKKSKCRSFPLRISSVNVTKSAENCGFGHIYWRNLNGKLHFLCSVICWFQIIRSPVWKDWAFPLIIYCRTYIVTNAPNTVFV